MQCKCLQCAQQHVQLAEYDNIGIVFTMKTRTNHFINDSNRSALAKYIYLVIICTFLFILSLFLSHTLSSSHSFQSTLKGSFVDMDSKSHIHDNCEKFYTIVQCTTVHCIWWKSMCLNYMLKNKLKSLLICSLFFVRLIL